LTHRSNPLAVYVEAGKRYTVAGALEWPGWCRGGRSEEAALRALIEYGPRYERVMRAAGISFQAPADMSPFEMVERLNAARPADLGAAGRIRGITPAALAAIMVHARRHAA